jgi:hypothetical protein
MTPDDDARPTPPPAPPQTPHRLTARARRAIGSAVLLAYLPVYVGLAATIGSALQGGPPWATLAFYAAAGFAWVVPLYPLFVWMRGPRPERGA